MLVGNGGSRSSRNSGGLSGGFDRSGISSEHAK